MKYILLFFLFGLPVLVHAQKFSDSLEPTEKEAVVHLIFKNSDGEKMAGEPISFEAKGSGKIYEAVTDKNGELDVLLPEGETYKIKISHIVKESVYHEFIVEDVPGIQSFGLELVYAPPSSITLEHVFFDTDKYELRPESFEELDKLYQYLVRHKYARIEIAGHTDNIGTSEKNLELSRNRAKAVLMYLVKKGIDARRLSAKGYGDTEPIEENSTPEGRQANRRVEIRFISH